MITIGPLAQAHIDQLALRVPLSIEGVAVVEGERALGMVGVAIQDGCQLIAAEFTAAALERMQHPSGVKAMLTAARRALAIARGRALPIYAAAHPQFEQAPRVLEHLGFVHFRQRLYKCPA